MSTNTAPATDLLIRVRYAETDRMGVVHHSNHFIWFETGRSEYCRARGFTYRQLEEETGCVLMVAEARCRYKAPLFYDDEVIIRTRLTKSRRRLIAFSYQILRTDSMALIAEGETIHLVADKNGKTCLLPAEYLQKLNSRGA